MECSAHSCLCVHDTRNIHAYTALQNATGTGPDAAVNNGSNGGGLSDQLWGVERRLEAVDSVIRYLDSKDAAGDLSYDEYEVGTAMPHKVAQG